jgi:Mg2+-importing ATPase
LTGVLIHERGSLESLWSQTLVIQMIRTPKIPFIHSRALWQFALLTTLGIATGTIFAYMLLAMLMKKSFVQKYGELL